MTRFEVFMVFAILVASCGTDIPADFRVYGVSVRILEPYDAFDRATPEYLKSLTDRYFEAAKEEWGVSDWAAVSIFQKLDGIKFKRDIPKICGYYSTSEIYLPGPDYYTKRVISIYADYDHECIAWEMTYTHELTHLFLERRRGDSDGNHKQKDLWNRMEWLGLQFYMENNEVWWRAQ